MREQLLNSLEVVMPFFLALNYSARGMPIAYSSVLTLSPADTRTTLRSRASRAAALPSLLPIKLSRSSLP